MAIWEQVLLGIGAAALLFFFWPSARAAMERSREAQERDWMAVLVPLALVVALVVLLVAVARA
jgi:uncharacterized membrane protein YidH (DUF202 family)